MKLVSPVQSFNVCFSYDPGNLEDEELDTFNRDIRENMLQSGRSIVNYAKIFGRTSIRIAFINPDMSESDVDVFFDNVLEAAGQLLQAA